MMATKWIVLIAVVLVSAGPASAINHDQARQSHLMRSMYANNYNNIYYSGLYPSASSGATQQPAGVPLPYASTQGVGNVQPLSPYTASTYGQSANLAQPSIAAPVAPSPATVTVEFADSPTTNANAAQTYTSTQTSTSAASAPAPDPTSITVDAADVPPAAQPQEAAVKSEPTTVTFTNSPARPLETPPAAEYNVAPTAEQASGAARLLPLYTQIASPASKTITINRPSDIAPQSPSLYVQFNGNPNRPATIESVQQTTAYSQQIPVQVSLNQPDTFLPQPSASIAQAPVQISTYLPSQGHTISSYTRPVEVENPPSPSIPQYRPPTHTLPPYGSASQNVKVLTSPGFAQTFGSTLKQGPVMELYVSPSGVVYLADQNGNLIPTQHRQYAPGYTSGFSPYAAPQPSHIGSMHPLTENDLKSDPSPNPAPIDKYSLSYNIKANDMMGLYKPITYLGPVSTPLRHIATFNNNNQPVRLSISAGRTAEEQKNINVPQPMAIQQEQKSQLPSNGQQNNSPKRDEEIRKLEEKINEKAEQANGIQKKMNSLSTNTGTVSNQQMTENDRDHNQMGRDGRTHAPGEEADPVVGNPQAIIRGLQELSKMGLGDLLVFSPPGYTESLARQGGSATAP